MPPSTDAAEANRVKPAVDASGKQNVVGQARSGEDNEAKPYVLTGELGKGSFATVYKGYHEDSHAPVAIKTVSKSILKPKLFDSLQSEIRIMKQLSHRHVVRLIDIVRAERNIYLIMEYCSGGDLTNYIKKRGKVETLEYVPSPGAAPIYYPHPRSGGLDEVVVRSFLRQLARALKFLRGLNLIHRDIKPQNLLLNPASPQELARGHPLGVPILKVADFGFAKSLPDAMMAETLCGSPLYMAPEILRYEKYDAKVDLWSVGAVLYETTVGKPPFRANNPMELLKKIEATTTIKFPDEDPAQLQKNPDLRPVPKDIKDLIRALLKRRPVDRATFDDFFTSNAMKNSKDQRRNNTRSETESSLTNGTGASQSNQTQDLDSEAVVLGTIGRNPRVVTGALANIPLAMKEHDRPAPSPPVASPVTAMASPSVVPPKVMFRRATGSGTTPLDSPVEANGTTFENPIAGAHIVDERARTGAAGDSDDAGLTKPLSPDGSFTHEMEDGSLRREYVLVGDTKAIELHRVVDELKTTRRAPLRERKSQQQSPTLEKRQSDYFQQGERDRTNPPPSANTTKDGVVNTTFPPPPHPYAPPLSSSPSRNNASALTRALSIASKKLFGTPSSTRATTPYFPEREPSRSPKRMPPSFGGRAQGMVTTPEEQVLDDAERDPFEEALLIDLEELAQKADVLTKWADEMFEYVKAIPQKPLPPPTKFTRHDSESERNAELRRNHDVDAEYNAVTCVALYILLMSFSQKGIDRLRVHQEGMKMRDPEGRLYVSEGFDDALRWFKEHFLKCNERAALVRAWLPENSSVEEIWLDQVVYDRALLLSRKAARMELLDPTASVRECEALYEESLWCLYALQDDVMQRTNPYRDEDMKTIAMWIEKTRKRFVSCQSKRKAQEAASAAGTGAPNIKRTSLEVNPAPQTPALDREERRYSPVTWERRASPRR